MRKIFITLFLASSVTISNCAATLNKDPIPQYSQLTFNGLIATKVQKLDLLLKNCGSLRNNQADNYNWNSNVSWYWDLLTAIAGLTAQSIAAVYSIQGQNETAKTISLYSGVGTAFLIGIKIPFQINNSLAGDNKNYSTFQSVIEDSKTRFGKIQGNLSAGDINAEKELDSILTNLTSYCPNPSGP
jgi:hypothetical protein